MLLPKEAAQLWLGHDAPFCVFLEYGGAGEIEMSGGGQFGHSRSSAHNVPPWVPPQLSDLVTEPPVANWVHEIKSNGYRMHARLEIMVTCGC